MTDSLDYKCVPLAEISPLIRISNKWPLLPLEKADHSEQCNWEAYFLDVKRLYGAGVTINQITEKLNILSADALRKKMRVWLRHGKIIKYINPKGCGRWRDEYNNTLREWLLAGGSLTQLSDKLGFSRSMLQVRARAIGFVAVTKGTNKAYWVLDNPAG